MFVKSPVEDEKGILSGSEEIQYLLVPGSSLPVPDMYVWRTVYPYETIVNAPPKFKELAAEYR